MKKIKSLDALTANEWLNNNEAILIDVREPKEYKEVHIAGAHLIPIQTLDITKLPQNDHKKIIVHCKLGKRGAMACEKLLADNPNLDIYNLEGGITAWEDAGLKVEK